MLKKTLFAMASLAFAGPSAHALPQSIHIDGIPHTIYIDPGPATFVQPARHVPQDSRVLFSNENIGDPKGTFFCCSGFEISGPLNSTVGDRVWPAIAFTPKKSGHVTEIDAGIGYVEGRNRITLGLWSDANGLPGRVLAEDVITVSQNFGECCAFVTFKDKVPVTAGIQYWVVAGTDTPNSDALSSWLYNSTNEVDTATEAYNFDGAWVSYASVPALNLTVYGK